MILLLGIIRLRVGKDSEVGGHVAHIVRVLQERVHEERLVLGEVLGRDVVLVLRVGEDVIVLSEDLAELLIDVDRPLGELAELRHAALVGQEAYLGRGHERAIRHRVAHEADHVLAPGELSVAVEVGRDALQHPAEGVDVPVVVIDVLVRILEVVIGEDLFVEVYHREILVERERRVADEAIELAVDREVVVHALHPPWVVEVDVFQVVGVDEISFGRELHDDDRDAADQVVLTVPGENRVLDQPVEGVPRRPVARLGDDVEVHAEKILDGAVALVDRVLDDVAGLLLGVVLVGVYVGREDGELGAAEIGVRQLELRRGVLGSGRSGVAAGGCRVACAAVVPAAAGRGGERHGNQQGSRCYFLEHLLFTSLSIKLIKLIWESAGSIGFPRKNPPGFIGCYPRKQS